MQNINSFLEACSNFKIGEKDLFEADELFYASDFPKVLTCLSAMSKTPVAGMAGIPKFPGKTARNSARGADGEDMYQSLEDLVGQNIRYGPQIIIKCPA